MLPSCDYNPEGGMPAWYLHYPTFRHDIARVFTQSNKFLCDKKVKRQHLYKFNARKSTPHEIKANRNKTSLKSQDRLVKKFSYFYGFQGDFRAHKSPSLVSTEPASSSPLTRPIAFPVHSTSFDQQQIWWEENKFRSSSFRIFAHVQIFVSTLFSQKPTI